jgi:hypothetical protein
LLLGRRPETLIANIEGVYRRFRPDRLVLKDCLLAAARFPSLFYQKPETLIEHVNIIKGLYRRAAVTFSKTRYNSGEDRPLRPLFEFLSRSPLFMTLSSETKCGSVTTDSMRFLMSW